MHHIAMVVAEDLHFDMPGRRQIFLEQHAIIAERATRLALCGRQRLIERASALDDPHASSAAACRCLDQNGKPDRRGPGRQLGRILIRTVIARHQRNIRLRHHVFRGRLVPHRPHGGRARSDEPYPRSTACIRKVGILRKEAITGMNRIGAGHAGGINHRIDIQIALGRGIGTDPHGLIGHRHMHRSRIGIGVDRDHVDAHALCCTRDPNRDFPAVGDQKALNHLSAPDLPSASRT